MKKREGRKKKTKKKNNNKKKNKKKNKNKQKSRFKNAYARNSITWLSRRCKHDQCFLVMKKMITSTSLYTCICLGFFCREKKAMILPRDVNTRGNAA